MPGGRLRPIPGRATAPPERPGSAANCHAGGGLAGVVAERDDDGGGPEGYRPPSHRASGSDASRRDPTGRHGDPLAWRVGDATSNPPRPADVPLAGRPGGSPGANPGTPRNRPDGRCDRDGPQSGRISRCSRAPIHGPSRAAITGEVRPGGRPAGGARRSRSAGADESWLPELASRLGVRAIVVHRWRWSGWLHTRQLRGENGRWIVWSNEAETERLERLREFEIEHKGRKRPPASLTTPASRVESSGATTRSQSGGS